MLLRNDPYQIGRHCSHPLTGHGLYRWVLSAILLRAAVAVRVVRIHD